MITACADPACKVDLTGTPEGEDASDHGKGYKLDMGLNFQLAHADEMKCDNSGREGSTVCYDAVVGHMIFDAKNIL